MGTNCRFQVFLQGFFYGILSLFIVSCQPSKPQNDAATLTAKSCSTDALGRYKQIVNGKLPDSTTYQEFKKLYISSSSACRNLLIKPITDQLFKISYIHPASVPDIADFYLFLSKDEGLTDRNRATALNRITAYYLFVANNTDSALHYIDLCQKTYGPIFDDSLLKSNHAYLGEAMIRKGKYQEAADHYLKAIALADKIKDSASSAGMSINFANIHSRMGNYEKAIAMRKKALNYFIGKDSNAILICWQGLGTDFGTLRNYDSAMLYNRKCLPLVDMGFSNPSSTQSLYRNIGGLMIGLDQYDSARHYFDMAKALMKQLPYDSVNEMMYVMTSTVAYAPIKNVDAEIEQIKSYIPVYANAGNLDGESDIYYCLYNIAALQHKPAIALSNYKKWDGIQNQLSNRDNQKYIAELETKYQTQRKELKIQLQQKEITQKKANNRLLSSLMILGVLGAVYAFNQIQLKNHRKEANLQLKFTNQLLQHTEEERGRIARDLHDGITHELMLLKNDIKTDNPEIPKKIHALINEVRMISRNLHPVMLEQIGLAASIEHICTRMMEMNQLFISCELNYQQSLSKNEELQLFRIIQEALNNIVKYADAHAAKVTIDEDKNSIHVSIRDNGKGFDVKETLNSKTSFGLLSILQRSKALNGKAEIIATDKGTIITIEIPKGHA